MAWITILCIAFLISSSVLAILWTLEIKRRKNLETRVQDLLTQSTKELMTDRLTGLLSLEGFESALARRAELADSSGGSFSVIYLALDDLGMINDGFGRDKAEKLLLATADILKSMTSESTTVCRINGGEFAFYVSGGIHVAQDFAQRLCRRMEQSIQVGAVTITATCSIGIAVYPEHGAHPKLLSFAALAMRTVKLAGGSDYCVYDAPMGNSMRDQVSLLLDLRKALELEQFELYFQPKVDSQSLQFTAAEALLRWHHPEKGFVSPAVFIPIAEKYGLMGPIGRWVIDEACKKGAHWKRRGLRMRVAVNISGFQMREDDLIEYIESTIARYGIAPNRFTCEITESVAMEDTKVTQHTFEKMRRAGFHVSIDDFGTGYSSLATLRKLPAAELKIDRAFVTDLESNEDARSIARSIISLGKTLKLRVVAEGIETIGQCEQLIKMGCDDLQGYLFAMPMPAEQLEEMAFDVSSNKSKDFRASLYSSTLMQDIG